MPKPLLSEEEFSLAIMDRVRQERPDIQVKALGKLLLLVEMVSGRRRFISLQDSYKTYQASSVDCDEVIDAILAAQVYQEQPEVLGSFTANRNRIMPQVVPPGLVEYYRHENRDMISVEYGHGLDIAFVLDEQERYSYIYRRDLERWGVSELDLLQVALGNLQQLNGSGEPFYMIGTGPRMMLVWETFDGYDASRILLTGELVEASTMVVGNPVIAIPQRDYMVMFGDSDQEFVARMSEQIRGDFETHRFAITPQLFTLVDGNLTLYDVNRRRVTLPN